MRVKEDLLIGYRGKQIAFVVSVMLAGGIILTATRKSSDTSANLDAGRAKHATYGGKRPPFPKFEDPVDYVSWANDCSCAGKDVNTSRIYDSIWRYGSSESSIAMPDQRLRTQLETLVDGPSWMPEEYTECAAYIDRIKPYLRVFADATQEAEFCLQSEPDPQMPRSGVIVPSFGSGEVACAALLASSWQTGREQKSRVLEAWLAALKYARHLGSSNMLLAVRSSSTVRLMVHKSIRGALKRGLVHDTDLNNTLSFLKELDPGTYALTKAFYLEWGLYLGLIQELYLGGRLNEKFARQITGIDEGGGLHPLGTFRTEIEPTDLAHATDEYFIRLLHISEQPLSTDVLETVEKLIHETKCGLLGTHPFGAFIISRPRKPFLLEMRALTSLRGTLSTLLIHKFRAENGEFPESLSVLELASADPFFIDPFSDAPFHYKKQGDDFLLYSVSEDGCDDGGTHGEWSPYYPTPSGTDFVFWPVPHGGSCMKEQ